MPRISSPGSLSGSTPLRRILYRALLAHGYPLIDCHRSVGGATNICVAIRRVRRGVGPITVSGRRNNSGWPFIREGVIGGYYYVLAVNDGYGYMQHSEYNALSVLDGRRRSLSGPITIFTERRPCRDCQNRLSTMTRSRANILYATDYPSRNARRNVRNWRRVFR